MASHQSLCSMSIHERFNHHHSPHIPRPRQSYKDIVSARRSERPEYEWLQTFLEHPGPCNSETLAVVFDSDGETLIERGQFSADTPQFSRILAARPSEVRTRYIVVSYQQSWNVDRSIVEKLCSTYNVEPDFFREHFYYHDIYSEDNDGPERWLKDPIHDELRTLPNGKDSVEYHLALTKQFDKMSTYIHATTPATPQTALIFIRHRKGDKSPMTNLPLADLFPTPTKLPTSAGADLASAYRALLRQMPREDIRVCDQDLHYVLYPYARMLLLICQAEFRKHYSHETLESFDNDRLGMASSVSGYTDKLCQIQHEAASLWAMHREVLRIRQLSSTPQATSRYSRMQHDISTLSIGYEKSAAQFTESTGALIAAQMKEVEASKKAAVSANRLSKVACAAIPLSVATQPLNLGEIEWTQVTPHLWTLFVTVLAIGLCSLIPVAPSIYYRTTRGAGSTENTKIIFKLVRHSPIGAFWYTLLCLRFEYAVVMALCGERLKTAFMVTRRVYYEELTRGQAEKRMRRSSDSAATAKYWLSKANCVADHAQQILEMQRPAEC